jgi:hypothetical protein
MRRWRALSFLNPTSQKAETGGMDRRAKIGHQMGPRLQAFVSTGARLPV